MKPFVVVAMVPNTMVDFRVPGYSPIERSHQYGFLPLQKETDGTSENKNQYVWYFETEDAAAIWAERLAHANPGIEYAVGTIGLVCIATPGPIAKSKYTPKGLLPA